MSTNNLSLYLESVFKLAKTLTIKSEYSAEKINNDLILKHGITAVDKDDPSSWKYYLNICGEYHPTDEVMHVVSLDTMQSIEFTKANLRLHPATAIGYGIGTRYHKELLLRYPKQELLIFGILYPANASTVVSAPNYSVVAWDKSLIEHNEEGIIEAISAFTVDYERRWRVGGFNLTHNLYETSFNNPLYQLLPCVIINIRNAAIGTQTAHSFLVKMHLASHQSLDEFIPYLTYEQTMWLYRNIKYIQNHAGHKSVFDSLIDKLLTERGIPVRGYDLVHLTSGLSSGNIMPDVGFEGIPINYVGDKTYVSPEAMRGKLSGKFLGNLEYDSLHPRAIEDANLAGSNRIPTKVLETTSTEGTAGSAVSLVEIALSVWPHAAASGRFNVFTRYNHPVNGSETTLNMMDAYYVFLYAYAKSVGGTLTHVPKVYAANAPVWPTPSVGKLSDIIVADELPSGYLETAHSLAIPAPTYVNLNQFKEAVPVIAEAHERLTHLELSVTSAIGYASAMITKASLWSEKTYTRTETGQNIHEYFASRAIDVSEMDQDQWTVFYTTLFNDVTGLSFEAAASENAVHKAMIQIMERLSSYSVLFVDPVASSVSKSFPLVPLKFEESAGVDSLSYQIPITSITGEAVEPELHLTYNFELAPLLEGLRVLDPVHLGDVEVDLQMESDSLTATETQAIEVTNLMVLPVNDEGFGDPDFIPGLQETLDSPEPFDEVPNQYDYPHRPVVPMPDKVDPNDLLMNLNLAMFKAPDIKYVSLGDFKPFTMPAKLRYFTDEQDTIVLNGIWFTGDDLGVAAFMPNIGIEKLATFKYLPTVDAHLDTWTMSGGPKKVDTFTVPDIMTGWTILEPTRHVKGFVDFKLIKRDHHTHNDISFTWTGGEYDLNVIAGGYTVNYDLDAVVQHHSIITRPSGGIVRFAIEAHLTPINLRSISYTKDTILLKPMVSSGSTYSFMSYDFIHHQYNMRLREYAVTEIGDPINGGYITPRISIEEITMTHAEGQVEVVDTALVEASGTYGAMDLIPANSQSTMDLVPLNEEADFTITALTEPPITDGVDLIPVNGEHDLEFTGVGVFLDMELTIEQP